MSGIAGVYRPDGRCVRRASLVRMKRAMAHRGPDGGEVWREENVGFIHQRLVSTKQARRERLPRRGPSGTAILTADVRLDNRARLVRALDLAEDGAVTDGDILLAAYERWGESAPEKLTGAFAFAVWDSRKEQLFCARDQFGVKPLYYTYADDKRVFAFASELKALLQLPEVSRQVNHEKIGDFLAAIHMDTSYTFYDEVHRLPPGHSMIVDRQGLRRHEYWSLASASGTDLRSDEEYVREFQRRLFAAVRSRVRSSDGVGVLLSGGLDSSSIVGALDEVNPSDESPDVQTFSAVIDGLPECDERSYMKAVRASAGYRSHIVPGDRCDVLDVLRQVTEHHGRPVMAPNVAMTWALHEAVREQDMAVVLDGTGGDEVVSYGYGYIPELARRNRWLKLTRELWGAAQIQQESYPRLLWQVVRRYGVPSDLTGTWLLRKLREWWPSDTHASSDGNASAGFPAEDIITSDFARHIDMADRYQTWRTTHPAAADTERERHYRMLTSPRQPAAFEALDSIGARHSIELRYPFWDRRLVTFCLSLPAEQKLRNGWDRSVLRRAMKGYIPEKVRLRRSKTNYLSHLSTQIRSQKGDRLERLVTDRSLEPYVDTGTVQNIYDRFMSSADSPAGDVFTLWKVAALALWLRET